MKVKAGLAVVAVALTWAGGYPLPLVHRVAMTAAGLSWFLCGLIVGGDLE